MNRRLRRLTGLSAGLTFVLVLLGVYTAAAGAGLSCAQRWPLCDGAVFGLFPANWLSFVEWFHRLVAMLTGFAILGTTVAAWRGGATRRVRWALAAATLVLPSQIVLGALTVTEYEWVVLTAHFVTALAIFTGVVLAALWTRDATGGAGLPRLDRPAAVAAALLAPLALLTPRLFVSYGEATQVAYYGLGLAAYTALLAAVTRSREAGLRRAGALAGAAAALVFVLLVVGRQVVVGTGTLLLLAATLVALGLAGGAGWLARAGGRPDAGPSGDAVRSDD